MDVACEVLLDRLRSEHHPIIITAKTFDHPVHERVPNWNFKKAKWDVFQDQYIMEITPDLFLDADDKMAIFSSTFATLSCTALKALSAGLRAALLPGFIISTNGGSILGGLMPGSFGAGTFSFIADLCFLSSSLPATFPQYSSKSAGKRHSLTASAAAGSNRT